MSYYTLKFALGTIVIKKLLALSDDLEYIYFFLANPKFMISPRPETNTSLNNNGALLDVA